MDYNHGLTNSTVNSSPMFGNSYAHAASPCPEPLYNIRSGPNLHLNHPSGNSPQGSSFSNFSPGRRTPDVISRRSLRYHPYHPLPAFAPYAGDIEFRRHATNLFADDGGKEVNGPNEVMDKNNFSTQSISKHPPTNYNPNVVPSNTPNTVTSQRNFSAQSIDNNPPTNYYDPNTASYHVPSNVMPKGNFPAQRTDNYPHTNYNPNAILNCTEAHTEVSVSNKEANQCNQQCSMANEQNHTDGKYSHVQVIEGNVDKTKISAVNSTVTEETNFITCADKDTDFNTQPQNDLLQGIFASTVQSATDVSDTQSLNSLDSSDYNLTHDNSSFSIEDIRQETLENADLSNYSFEPIFEGKDENGEDMVDLPINSSAASSSTQQVDESENGAFSDNQNSEMRNDRADLNSISGEILCLLPKCTVCHITKILQRDTVFFALKCGHLTCQVCMRSLMKRAIVPKCALCHTRLYWRHNRKLIL